MPSTIRGIFRITTLLAILLPVTGIAGTQQSINSLKHKYAGQRLQSRLGKVLAGGKDVNLEQVRAGMAWHYKAYERTQSATDRQAYADAENEAKAAKLGLWHDDAPVPPWEWRHSK